MPTFRMTLLLLLLCAATATAQTYPSRAVRIIIPHAPAGGTDILARTIAQKLSETTGQQFIVDNRAGGNSIIGMDMVARSGADGHTLLFTTNIITINPWLYAKLPFSVDDFAPITVAGSTPSLLAIHPSLPAKTLKQLVALARSKPGQLTMSAAGSGTPSHLAGEFFKQTANVDVLIVQYKGTGASLGDLVGGHVTLAFGSLPGLSQLVNAGKVRAIAVTSAKRVPSMPEVPAFSETYPDFEVLIWYGLFAPAKTSRDIVNLLQDRITKSLAGEEVRQRLADQGFSQGGATPEQFAELIRRDMARWQKVIARAKIRVE
jgi:tripartite-type tricarboxylate transporter receptor subunit TctC